MSHRVRQGVLISSTLLAASMICAATPTASSVLAEAIHTPAMVQDSSALSPNTTNQAQAIVDAAASQEGLTYCWDGGTTSGPSHGDGDYDGEAPDCVNPDTVGFDCSGLALYAVFQATGIVLPHNAAEQGADYASYGGTLISSQSNLEPGDLVYFGGGSMVKATHVGIYAGDGEMWDANTAWGSYPDGVHERSMSRTEDGSAGLPFDGGVRYWTGNRPNVTLRARYVGPLEIGVATMSKVRSLEGAPSRVFVASASGAPPGGSPVEFRGSLWQYDCGFGCYSLYGFTGQVLKAFGSTDPTLVAFGRVRVGSSLAVAKSVPGAAFSGLEVQCPGVNYPAPKGYQFIALVQSAKVYYWYQAAPVAGFSACGS